MPRHEIIVERIPCTSSRASRCGFLTPSAMPNIYTQTVADYRSQQPQYCCNLCHSCDISFDMSSLVPVFDVWGPATRSLPSR